MELKPLNIDGLIAKIPIVQGGMGVGISLDRLAGNVALAGGVGIISTAQIGFREPGYDEKPLETNLFAIKYADKNSLSLIVCLITFAFCIKGKLKILFSISSIIFGLFSK